MRKLMRFRGNLTKRRAAQRNRLLKLLKNGQHQVASMMSDLFVVSAGRCFKS